MNNSVVLQIYKRSQIQNTYNRKLPLLCYFPALLTYPKYNSCCNSFSSNGNNEDAVSYKIHPHYIVILKSFSPSKASVYFLSNACNMIWHDFQFSGVTMISFIGNRILFRS